jgi:hypothetical protein
MWLAEGIDGYGELDGEGMEVVGVGEGVGRDNEWCAMRIGGNHGLWSFVRIGCGGGDVERCKVQEIEIEHGERRENAWRGLWTAGNQGLRAIRRGYMG